MTAWDLFLNDLNSRALSHAYMVSSSDAPAVSEFLRRAAQAVMCTEDNPPCGECIDCKKTANGTHPDVYSVPAAGKKILVDDVLTLIDTCYVKPLERDRKVYVLNNFCEANEKAQNKLLKILEEPVKNTVFLLGAVNMQYVLPTVKSRVKKLLIEDNLAFFLTASSPEHTAVLDAVADMYLNMKRSSDILDFANTFSKFKDLSGGFLNILELYTRDIILCKAGNENLILYKAQKNDIIETAGNFSLTALAAIQKNIAETRRRLGYNINLVMALDSLLYSILEEKHKHG